MDSWYYTTLEQWNMAIGILFFLCYLHQFLYIPVSLLHRPKQYRATAKDKRYAVLICARNEACTLPDLLESLRAQTYPAAQIAVYVAADHCTDQTAEIARTWGATVWERWDTQKIGKGYVLDFLLAKIRQR